MDQRNLISSMILFLSASFVLLTSLGLGIGSFSNPQTGFLPFWTSLLMMVLSLALFGTAYADKSITVRWSDLWRKTGWIKTLAAAVLLALYLAALPLLGFVVATAALMTILFKLGSMKLWTAVPGAIISVLFTYGLFHFLLQTPLPRGIWGF